MTRVEPKLAAEPRAGVLKSQRPAATGFDRALGALTSAPSADALQRSPFLGANGPGSALAGHRGTALPSAGTQATAGPPPAAPVAATMADADLPALPTPRDATAAFARSSGAAPPSAHDTVAARPPATSTSAGVGALESGASGKGLEPADAPLADVGRGAPAAPATRLAGGADRSPSTSDTAQPRRFAPSGLSDGSRPPAPSAPSGGTNGSSADAAEPARQPVGPQANAGHAAGSPLERTPGDSQILPASGPAAEPVSATAARPPATPLTTDTPRDGAAAPRPSQSIAPIEPKQRPHEASPHAGDTTARVAEAMRADGPALGLPLSADARRAEVLPQAPQNPPAQGRGGESARPLSRTLQTTRIEPAADQLPNATLVRRETHLPPTPARWPAFAPSDPAALFGDPIRWSDPVADPHRGPLDQLRPALERSLAELRPAADNRPGAPLFARGAPDAPAPTPAPVRVIELRLQPATLGTLSVTMRLSPIGLKVSVSASVRETAARMEEHRQELDALMSRAGHENAQIDIVAEPFAASGDGGSSPHDRQAPGSHGRSGFGASDMRV